MLNLRYVNVIYHYIVLLCVPVVMLSIVSVVNLILFVTFLMSCVCVTVHVHVCVLCTNFMKCHGLLGQCLRIWPRPVFFFWQFALLGILHYH